MEKTIDFLRNCQSQPSGAAAVTAVPPEVEAELQAENVSIGGFIQLVPLLLQLLQNEQLREFVRKFVEALGNRNQ